MKSTLSFFLSGMVLLAMVTLPSLTNAQGSPLLQLSSLQAVPGQPVQFSFTDTGTGATGYDIEFTTSVGSTANWTNLSNAIVIDQGAGLHAVILPPTQTATGFYRVRAIGTSVPAVTASFSSTSLEVTEGGVIAPVIQFSAPYFGTIHYTIGGTASSGDYEALSGEVSVNGTSATIPISIEDNKVIGTLKQLTLTLEAGPGIQLTGDSETIITILENDSPWQGSFLSANSMFGFVLTIQQSNTVYMASLKSERFGFFPTNAIPTSIQLTEDIFSASTINIPVEASSTLLNLPMSQTLVLGAVNGEDNQLVSPTRIQGISLLITEVPGSPHLNSTNLGSFLLLRPPNPPSTNEIDLVDRN